MTSAPSGRVFFPCGCSTDMIRVVPSPWFWPPWRCAPGQGSCDRRGGETPPWRTCIVFEVVGDRLFGVLGGKAYRERFCRNFATCTQKKPRLLLRPARRNLHVCHDGHPLEICLPRLLHGRLEAVGDCRSTVCWSLDEDFVMDGADDHRASASEGLGEHSQGPLDNISRASLDWRVVQCRNPRRLGP